MLTRGVFDLHQQPASVQCDIGHNKRAAGHVVIGIVTRAALSVAVRDLGAQRFGSALTVRRAGIIRRHAENF